MTTAALRLAVASGKGGTGKTTLATSIARSLTAARRGVGGPATPCLFVDCDVEAPDGHLFLAPTLDRRKDVAILRPNVDDARCDGCGRCAAVCAYGAIVVLRGRPLVLPDLCHGCGSCALVCPRRAITETPHVIGVLEAGSGTAGIPFARGVLNVGESQPTPIIRELMRWAVEHACPDTEVVVLDVSPGTSCPAVEAQRGADFVVLVTEPTPFGLHDLGLAVEVAADLGIPCGIVVNRDGIGDRGIDAFSERAGVPILLRIPFERGIAEGIAQGRTLVDVRSQYAPPLLAMMTEIAHRVRRA